MNTPEIRVERRLSATPDRVFDAWLDPVWIGRFMFGAHLRDEQVVSLENDPRVGGTFHYRVTRRGTEIDHTGTYREIDRPRSLVFTWGVDTEQGDLSVVTINLAPDGDGCLLTLTHKLHPDWADYAERTQAGWTKIVGDLEANFTRDFARNELIACSAERCYNALTQNIAAWWSAQTDGAADGERAEFTVRFGATFKRFKVVELQANRTVVWRCVESHLDLESLAVKSEWNGTEIRWSIKPRDDGILLSVTHAGLNPSIGCFEACEQGWDHFLINSLKPYLETGAGLPHVEP